MIKVSKTGIQREIQHDSTNTSHVYAALIFSKSWAPCFFFCLHNLKCHSFYNVGSSESTHFLFKVEATKLHMGLQHYSSLVGKLVVAKRLTMLDLTRRGGESYVQCKGKSKASKHAKFKKKKVSVNKHIILVFVIIKNNNASSWDPRNRKLLLHKN